LLKCYRAFIFDLDGCIYRGDLPLTGAAEAVDHVRKLGKKVLFLTNNATRTPEDFARKLSNMGVESSPSEVLTSATATATYLLRNFGASKVFPVGGKALIQELRRMGHRIVNAKNVQDADFVVACLDFNFTYLKMKLASQAIFSGAKFVATNIDPTLPVEGGMAPGAGAIVSAISTVTRKAPLIIGKPSRHIVDVALERLGEKANRVVFIGDRLDTDVQAGKEVGAFTILVLSGSTRLEEAARSELKQKPDLILPDVGHLRKYLQ
jgi:4-nitrophenyl phosphatase